MPIALQDAIERTQLASDESGYITQYTFDQFLNALDEKDKHAYVTALADLGIMAKYSSTNNDDILHMQDVIYDKAEEQTVQAHDITEEFLKAAQHLRKKHEDFDDAELNQGLNIDWEEEEEEGFADTMIMDKTDPSWPAQTEPAQQDDGPLWPSQPGMTYTDSGQTQEVYDPDMDLSVDPETPYDQTTMAPVEDVVQPEDTSLWPSQPGMAYTGPGQEEEAYDPDLDMTLSPLDDEYDDLTNPGGRRGSDVTDKLLKAAADFVRSPGGLWMPDSMQEDEEAPEEDPNPFYGWQDDEPDAKSEDGREWSWGSEEPKAKQEDPNDPGYEILESRDINEAPPVDTSEAEEVLTQHNIKVHPDGTVTFQQATSGFEGEGVANLDYLLDETEVSKPMPIEKAIGFFNQKLRGANIEQERIKGMQDTLLNFTQIVGNIDNDIFMTMDKLDEALASLESFKYNEKSPDSNISEIAKGLTGIKSALQEKMYELEDFSEQFSAGAFAEYLEPVKEMQNRLDEYVETQYNKVQDNESIINALQTVSQSVPQAQEQNLQQPAEQAAEVA